MPLCADNIFRLFRKKFLGSYFCFNLLNRLWWVHLRFACKSSIGVGRGCVPARALSCAAYQVLSEGFVDSCSCARRAMGRWPCFLATPRGRARLQGVVDVQVASRLVLQVRQHGAAKRASEGHRTRTIDAVRIGLCVSRKCTHMNTYIVIANLPARSKQDNALLVHIPQTVLIRARM